MTDDSIHTGAHWQRFATRDAEQGHDYLRKAYVDLTVRSSDDPGKGFNLRSVSTELGDISLSRTVYSAHALVETAPDGDLNITRTISGRYSLIRGKDESRVTPGEVYLLLPDDAHGVEFDNIEAFITRLPRALMEEAAHTPAGFNGSDLRFDSMRPISAQLGRHWSATVSYVTQSILSEPSLRANPLITAEARLLLARTALAVFPNTSLDGRPGFDGDVRPRGLRRALAYIDDNAGRPITVTQVAAATGLHPRSLQLAFRRHLGTTPTNYLRRVRLEHAHRDLRNADPATGVTVTMIANRWGFPHLGRFSADYRRAYGFSPSHTLRT